MRVLLCSDIHGNAEALGAVLKEPADYVLCAGDLVHFGPQPKTCISLIRKRAAVVVRGNHDHGAGFGENCRAYGPWQALDERCRTMIDTTIPEADCEYLRSLPLMAATTLGKVRFTVVHAAPSDPLYHYLLPGTSDEVWGAELSMVDSDVLVLGHTHLPLLYPHMHPLVVNPGSVGLPRDGGPRAEYAMGGWSCRVPQVHLRPDASVESNREAAVASCHAPPARCALRGTMAAGNLREIRNRAAESPVWTGSECSAPGTGLP